MDSPSTEFDNAVTSLCHGTATGDDAGELHGVLQSSSGARDEYLWQVELHALLASRNAIPAVDEEVITSKPPRLAHSKLRRPVRSSRVTWAVTAGVLLVFTAGSLWWANQNRRTSEPTR